VTKKSTVMLNLTLISLIGISSSCSKHSQKKESQLSSSLASQLSAQGKVSEASDMYSRIGEILLSRPEGVFHAESMFKKSLELNPYDNKANIYSAVIAPVLTTKGFLKRFKNIATENELQAKELEQRINDSGVKEFIDFALVMPAGKKAAISMEDVRSFYRNEYAKELENSITKLNNIKSDKFSIDLNISAYQSKKTSSSICKVDSDGAFICDELKAQELQGTVRRSVDAYDLKALKIILKTQKNAMKLAYSVGLEGFENVNILLSRNENNTDKMIVDAIRSQPNLLKIDGTKEDLRDIFNHSEEVMNDLIDFSKISKEVCNNENRTSNIANNICVSEQAADKINEILMFVVGPKSVVLGLDKDGSEVSVEVDLRALLDSKVTSLQELLPNKFNAEGRATDVRDLTFAGIIPNADLLAKLKTVVK
jgi:hypothetical protein